ncbi:MAG: amidase family protein, partial [Gammaproteobacteria bacterium]
RGRVNRVFSGVDIVLAPAFMHQNPTVEAFSSFGERDTDWPELLRFTAPFDLSGTPTLSLPCGFNEDGAPYGFQLLAGNLNESLLTRAGHVYQQHTDFHCQQPKDYQ